jgi:putative sigma-54 modulation protein
MGGFLCNYCTLFRDKFQIDNFSFPFFLLSWYNGSMKITIKATGLELTPSIQEYAEKRVESLEKFIHTNSGSVLAQIEVGMISRHHKSGDIFRAEVNVSVNGEVLYAWAEKDDLYASIDEMHNKMERELASRKDKKINLMKRGETVVKKILRRAK